MTLNNVNEAETQVQVQFPFVLQLPQTLRTVQHGTKNGPNLLNIGQRTVQIWTNFKGLKNVFRYF
jgi:hypothetical protein